jgi:glycosyltransferase involved in cell wall biosynthesis
LSAVPSRTAPCTCGSGKRYKDCCGAIKPVAAAPSIEQTLSRALEAQLARQLTLAETLYRQALAINKDHADALHMLGVVRMELGNAHEAVALIMQALDATAWRFPAFRHNLGLALAKCVDDGLHGLGFSPRARTYREFTHNRSRHQSTATPLVSVVIPSYNHRQYLESAIESVFEQDYANIEIAVVDDGSTDGSSSLIAELAKRSPFPFEYRVRTNRGAHATLNELATMTHGAWIQPLNSDDALERDRISTMLRATADADAHWAFGGIVCIDDKGLPIDELHDRRAFEFRCLQSEVSFADTVSSSFFTGNPAISSGNLFLARDLFEKLGGFADLRYHHDWDFCLRASRIAEPVFVPKTSYRYRFHETNTINENSDRRMQEIDRVIADHVHYALTSQPVNIWAPCYALWGMPFVSKLLSSGMSRLIQPDSLRGLANSILSSTNTDRARS